MTPPDRFEFDDLAMGSGTLNVPSKDAAEALVKKLTQRIARHFQGLNDPAMLRSGQDSGLKNLWDEICVQQQAFVSVDWRSYERMIEGAASGYIDDLTPAESQALWVLTEKGSSWHYDVMHGLECDPKEALPVDEDLVEMITARLLSVASDHTSKRIRKYLDRETW